jgi:hypothetical protein
LGDDEGCLLGGFCCLMECTTSSPSLLEVPSPQGEGSPLFRFIEKTLNTATL